MTDCTCHAGKICSVCEVEVMGNLNERLKGRTNYHDSEDGLMSPNSIDDEDAKSLDEEMTKAMISLHGFRHSSQYTSPEKIERDILDELSMLRQKVADLDTAKAFHVAIYENIIERLKDAEDQVRIMDRVLGGLELQRLRGNG